MSRGNIAVNVEDFTVYRWNQTGLNFSLKDSVDEDNGVDEESELRKKIKQIRSDQFQVESDPEHSMDWHGRFQTLLESPNNADKFIGITRLTRHFLYVAETYGKVIISELFMPSEARTIPFYNTSGVEYLCKNILFKLAIDKQDGKGTWLFGINERNDEIAIKATQNELKHSILLYHLKSPEIKVPLMCLIHYRGYAILAQAKLPSASQVVYGSPDKGRSVVNTDPKLASLMKATGRRLNLRAENFGETELYGPMDAKGYRTPDNHYYFLNLKRLMPPEANSVETQWFSVRLLRPEIVKKAPEPLSSDSFTNGITRDPSYMVDNLITLKTTGHLHNEVIPRFAKKMKEKWPIDHLIAKIHNAGINLRHMGKLRSYARNAHIRQLLLTEIIARVMKNEFWYLLRTNSPKIKTPINTPFLEIAHRWLKPLLSTLKPSPNGWIGIGPGQIDTAEHTLTCKGDRFIVVSDEPISQHQHSFYFEVKLVKGRDVWIGLIDIEKQFTVSNAQSLFTKNPTVYCSYRANVGQIRSPDGVVYNAPTVQEGDVLGVFYNRVKKALIFTKNNNTIGATTIWKNTRNITPSLMVWKDCQVKYNFGPTFQAYPNSFDILSFCSEFRVTEPSLISLAEGDAFWKRNIKTLIEFYFPSALNEDEKKPEFNLRSLVVLSSLMNRFSHLSGVQFSRRAKLLSDEKYWQMELKDIEEVGTRVKDMNLLPIYDSIGTILSLTHIQSREAERELLESCERKFKLATKISITPIQALHWGKTWAQLAYYYTDEDKVHEAIQKSHKIFLRITGKKRKHYWAHDSNYHQVFLQHGIVLCRLAGHYFRQDNEEESGYYISKAILSLKELLSMDKNVVIEYVNTVALESQYNALTYNEMVDNMMFAKCLTKSIKTDSYSKRRVNLLLKIFHIILVFSEAHLSKYGESRWSSCELVTLGCVIAWTTGKDTTHFTTFLKQLCTTRDISGYFLAVLLKLSSSVECIREAIVESFGKMIVNYYPPLLCNVLTVLRASSNETAFTKILDKVGESIIPCFSSERIAFVSVEKEKVYKKATLEGKKMFFVNYSSKIQPHMQYLLANHYNLIKDVCGIEVQPTSWDDKPLEAQTISFPLVGLCLDPSSEGLLFELDPKLKIGTIAHPGIEPRFPDPTSNLKEEMLNLSFMDKMRIAENLARVMLQVHKKGIVMCNLSPATIHIVVNGSFAVRLVDFSWATPRGALLSSGIFLKSTEAWLHQSYSERGICYPDFSWDLHSFGCILSYLVSKTSEDKIFPELRQLIANLTEESVEESVSGEVTLSFENITKQDIFRKAVFWEACAGEPTLLNMWSYRWQISEIELASALRKMVGIGHIATDPRWIPEILYRVFPCSNPEQKLFDFAGFQSGLYIYGLPTTAQFTYNIYDILSLPGFLGFATWKEIENINPGTGVIWLHRQSATTLVIFTSNISGDLKPQVIPQTALMDPKMLENYFTSNGVVPYMTGRRSVEELPVVRRWAEMLDAIEMSNSSISAKLKSLKFSPDDMDVAWKHAIKSGSFPVCELFIRTLAETKAKQMSMLLEVPAQNETKVGWLKFATEICRKLPPETIQDLFTEAALHQHTVGKAFLMEKAQKANIYVSTRSRKLKFVHIGTTESGFRSILKQLRILYGREFSQREMKWFHHELIKGVALGLIKYSEEVRTIFTFKDEILKILQDLAALNLDNASPEPLTYALQLWNDKQFQSALSNYPFKEFVSGFPSFCLSEATQILREDYTPTELDILNIPSSASGVIDFRVDIEDVSCQFVYTSVEDYKLWLDQYTGSNYLIFGVSLLSFLDPGHAQVTLKVFQDVCRNLLFKKINVILLMVKFDLLSAKIAAQGMPVVKEALPEYAGSGEPKDVATYIISQFEKAHTAVVAGPICKVVLNMMNRNHVKVWLESVLFSESLRDLWLI